MPCPACGHDNRDGRRFCAQCGAALAPVCAACGTQNEPGERFCGGCGQALAAAPAQQASTPAEPSAPPLPASFAGGRYAVRSFLGEGGRKRVYLARDARLDRDVAVAVIKTEGLDAPGRQRIEREAQAMGRLGDHGHIVSVYDVGEDAGQPFIVSQYMGGGDLHQRLQQLPQRQLPLAEAVRIASEICDALEYAHARGVVHRDVKPGNIWFTPDGSARLGDFGLAVALDRSRLTMAGMMVGTAAYMPPEQAMGGETTAASDLYALGCVLYETVTGRPPFVGDDAVAVISQHLNTPAVSPTWHRPDCPPSLETLIHRLLEKDPKQRPASAGEVLRILAAIDTAAPATAASTASPSAAVAEANPIYRRTFVGREHELKQLQQAFDAALSGQGGLITVVGEPGIGKTTLTEQLTTYVAMRGGRALVGHCYEEGSLALPYLAFVEAMRSYALDHDREELARELGTGAGEVARIVSEVRQRLEVELPPAGNPEEERFRLFQAVSGFLRNSAAVRPLCIVLEDLHDADKGTMEMLVHISRNLAGARLLLVATYRDVEVDRTHPLSSALAELRRVDSFARIPLRGLTPDEAQRMLSNIAGQEVPYVLAEAVYRQTEGNPLFIQEVIRFAAEEGLIRREGGQWVPTTVDSLMNYVPEGLRDVIGKRLSRLSESCNRVLSVAAVMGREFSLDVLQAVVTASEDELLVAIEEATRVSLLEERSEGREVRYRFTHAFFRQTLYEEMIAPRRLRMHREVALALERHYAGHLNDHASELFEHFSHSSSEEDLAKAVHYGELAAQRAVSVYAHGEAVRLLEQVVQVQDVLDPNDLAKRFELLASQANSQLSAGDGKRVYDAVAPELFAIAERLGRDDLAAVAAEIACWGMGYTLGAAAFTTPEYDLWVERLDKSATPESRARSIADGFLSWRHYARGELEACWKLRRSALELARRVGDPEALSNALFVFISTSGPPQLVPELLRAADEVVGVSRTGIRPATQGNILFARGVLLLDAGRRDDAYASFSELDDYADRIADPFVRVWQMASRTLRLGSAGEIERAAEVARDFGSSAEALGSGLWGFQFSVWVSAPNFVLLGRFEEALAHEDAWDSVVWGRAVRAWLLASAGKRDDAQATLDRFVAEQHIVPGEGWADMNSLAPALAAAVILGDTATATVIAQRLAGLEGWYLAAPAALVGRQLAMASLLQGDHATARRQLGVALEGAESRGIRPEAALTRLALARVLFEHFNEERAEAGRYLDVAVAELRAMKMRPALEEAMRLKLQFQGIMSTDIYTSIDSVAASVQRERPALPQQALAPDGTVTIMFSDIEDSTLHTERLGDERWQEVLRTHNQIIRDQIRAHDGFEVKTMGDGFMVAFQSARRGLDCAVAIQRAFASGIGDAEPGVEPLRVRVGLHAGEALREGDDFFGKNVIVASRVAGQARGGEILVSALLRQIVESTTDSRIFSPPRSVELKGLAGAHVLHAVAWNEA